jgi:hypothetical protein
MEHSKYITQAVAALQNQSTSVIVFQAAAYSHIFFMQLFEYLKNQQSIDYKTIDIQSGDFAFKSQLSTSFLGMECTYSLGDTTTLKPKLKDDLVHYLQGYQGPHKVIMFVDEKTKMNQSANLIVLAMKDKYFAQDAKSLWESKDSKQVQKTALFLHEVYKIKNSFTLDELCLLKNYQDLISGDAKEFYASWITRLVIPDTSLFTLSQLLFEKKEEAFFRLWLEIKPLYADMFWIAFWSDQLYRSYFFIAFTQQENFAAVKQVSFGLSFAFMKQSYKQYQLDELQRFHQAFYAIDTALKNGGNSYQIDQIYVDFFAGKFKN